MLWEIDLFRHVNVKVFVQARHLLMNSLNRWPLLILQLHVSRTFGKWWNPIDFIHVYFLLTVSPLIISIDCSGPLAGLKSQDYS